MHQFAPASSPDSDVSTLLEGREHRSVQFSAAEGEQASLAMLRAVATLAHHNPDVPSRVLDHDVLKVCCMLLPVPPRRKQCAGVVAAQAPAGTLRCRSPLCRGTRC